MSAAKKNLPYRHCRTSSLLPVDSTSTVAKIYDAFIESNLLQKINRLYKVVEVQKGVLEKTKTNNSKRYVNVNLHSKY